MVLLKIWRITAWSQKQTSSTDPEIHGWNIACKIYSVEQFSNYVECDCVQTFVCSQNTYIKEDANKKSADSKFQVGV